MISKLYRCIALPLLVVLLSGAPRLLAQHTPDSVLMSLDSCIRYARIHSIDVRSAHTRLRSARAEYRRAIGNLLPEISASSNASFNFGRGLNAETNTYTDVNSFSNSYGISAGMTLFDGFKSLFQVEEQRLMHQGAQMDVHKQYRLIALGTAEAYYNLLYNRGLLRLAEEKLQESSHLLRQISRMEELGNKSYADVLEAAAREADDRARLTSARMQMRIAELQLKEKMNWEIERELLVDSIPMMILDSVSVPLMQTDADRIYATALQTDPSMQMARLQVRVADASAKAAFGSLLPRISLSVGFNTGFSRFMDGSAYEPFREQIKNRWGSYVGLNLSIPIFTGFSTTTSLIRARANRLTAHLEEERARHSLYVDVTRLVGDMQGALEQYVQGVANVKATGLAYRAAVRRYEVGLINAIELSAVANRYLEARINCLRAHTQYLLKCRYVSYYQGEAGNVE